MKITLPVPRSTIVFPISRVSTNGAVRLIWRTESQMASPCSAAGTRMMVPALLTRMSTGRSAVATWKANSDTAVLSPRSTRKAENDRPAASTRPCTSLPAASS